MNDDSRRLGDAATALVIPREVADYVPRTLGPVAPVPGGNDADKSKSKEKE